MEKKSVLEERLLKIINDNDAQGLMQFKDQIDWSSMAPNEAFLLGLAFVIQGEEQLARGENAATESFDLAIKASPNSPELLHRIALAYNTQTNNKRCLLFATQAIEMAVALNPQDCTLWCTWGCTLLYLGQVTHDFVFFQEADQKFAKAVSLSQHSPLQGEIYWRWAICWHLLARMSEEAHDYHVALEKYRLASKSEINHSRFWNEFGDVLVELAALLKRPDLLQESLHMFLKVTELDPDHFMGWLNLACSAQCLYEDTLKEEYLNMANEGYSKAAALNETNATLWLNWATYLMILGKDKMDQCYFYDASEKFARAHQCDPDNTQVLTGWAEALLLCGGCDERLELLRKAEEMVIKSLEMNSDSVEGWKVYGMCLSEVGKYFSEESYFNQAIEKFRYALTFNQDVAEIWHYLALTYYAYGDMTQDRALLEESIQCFSKVLKYEKTPPPLFWNQWGVTYMVIAELSDSLSHCEEAIDCFERAMLLTYENGMPLDLEWEYNYGCAYDFLGSFTEESEDYEKAVHFLTHVVEEDSTHTNARFNLAVALSHLAEINEDPECYQKALHHFEMVVTADAEDEMGWNDWGLTLMSYAYLMHDPMHPENTQKLLEQAESKFTHAIALGCTASFYHLACLYSLAGNYTAAMHYLERAEMAEALPSIEDVLHDEWLENLRETADFRNFISIKYKQR